DSSGYLGPGFPIRGYLDSLARRALSDEASSFGEDGERVAYAANYLGLQPSSISEVLGSWNSSSPDTRLVMGGSIPTATAAIVADELTNTDTTSLAQRYPDSAWIHAHATALIAFPCKPYL